jgi:Fur family transcriptional regulator, zinc uptake regulator
MTQSHAGHDHVWADDLTKNQELVLGTLAHSGSPLSAYNILDKLRDDGIKAPLQVYRALDKLVERGLAHRLESLNAFVACSDTLCHRKGILAFAICDRCGRVDEFSDDVVKERLNGWAADKGFTAERTTIEMRGICAGCGAA